MMNKYDHQSNITSASSMATMPIAPFVASQQYEPHESTLLSHLALNINLKPRKIYLLDMGNCLAKPDSHV